MSTASPTRCQVHSPWNLLSKLICDRSLPGSDGSTKQAIDFRQELGEVELGRASGTGGVEVGSLPASFFLRELGIGVAGPTAGAMMLMVGQEAGQIAQPRVGPRGASTPAVASAHMIGPASMRATRNSWISF